jgi:MFS superfamily sulfate permease-like transporter
VLRDSSIAKEIPGGAMAAALTLPVGISLGIVTLEPLGSHYAPLGVAAGVYGVALCSALMVLLGSRSPAINLPRSVTAVFVAAMLLEATGVHRVVAGGAPSPGFLYGLLFLFLALSGIFQALIGALRLGMLVKYLPHAVLAGFMNAVAILLAFAQLPALVGMPAGSAPADLMVVPGEMRTGAMLVAGITLAALWLPKFKVFRDMPVPPLFIGLIVGTLAHHLLASVGMGGQLGPVLGEAAARHPQFDTALGFREVLDNPAFAQALPGVAAAAFGLALISSLDTLLLMKAFERITHERQDSQRDLARLGIANTVTACLGAIPCSMGLAASQSNHAAGGRGPVSVLAHAAIVLAAILALGSLVAAIPRAVVAALMLSIAFVVIDRPTIATIRRLASGKVRNRARLATDLLVMLAVAGIAIVGSVALAVVAGVVIAVLSFLVNMSHSVVRRVTLGDAMRSRRSRETEQMGALARQGRRIAVIELEGVLFFGTADDALATIDACLRQGTTHVIVDLGRVNDVDTTGAQMLIQVHERVRARGGMLLLAHAAPGQPQRDFLDDTGVVAHLGAAAFMPDIDTALEAAEDALLDAEGAQVPERAEIPLEALHPFAQLTPAELSVLQPLLERRTFGPGEFVFREGDPGDELYVIALGTASVRREEGSRSTRLVTFGEGTVFGEMALLDARPRSASVQADRELVCFAMPRAAFQQIVERHQAIAVKLLTSLAQELGRRLRFTNEIVERLQA